MRHYEDLTLDEQAKAMEISSRVMLEAVTRFHITFSDPAVQQKVQDAWDRADQMKTPWFAHEYIAEAIPKELKELAENYAASAVYLSADDNVIRL